MATKIEVFKDVRKLRVDCECGYSFHVAGKIPVRTVCDSCKTEIGLRLALAMLNR